MCQEMVKTKAKKQRPVNSALREQIEHLFKADQAVREKYEFDLEKMSKTDLEHRAALEAIFLKYGVRTYRMAGPQESVAKADGKRGRGPSRSGLLRDDARPIPDRRGEEASVR